jgi:hypothetical protein
MEGSAMTNRPRTPTIRPVATTFLVEQPDENNRTVAFHVQITATGISAWTDGDTEIGKLSIPALYAACVQKAATGTK